MKKVIPILFVMLLVLCSTALAVTSTTVDVDNRYRASDPVAVEALSISIDSTPSGGLSVSTGNTTITKSGYLKQVCVIAPDLSHSSELSVTVVNADSIVLWTSDNYSSGSSNLQRITEDTAPLIAGTTTVNVNTNMSQSDAVDDTAALLLYVD